MRGKNKKAGNVNQHHNQSTQHYVLYAILIKTDNEEEKSFCHTYELPFCGTYGTETNQANRIYRSIDYSHDDDDRATIKRITIKIS